MRWRWWLPNLAHRRGTTFVLYFAVALAHGAFAVIHSVDSNRFDASYLDRVYQYIPEPFWIMAGAAIWAAMTVAAYAEWWGLARAALALGAFTCLLRAWLIEENPTPSGATALWMVLAAVVHFYLIAEPPETPPYARDHA